MLYSFKGQIDLYCHKETDTDLSQYYVINAEVKPYFDDMTPLGAKIRAWSESITDGLYIKGNRIFFTYKGVKYYELLGSFEEEWWCINQIIEDLAKAGAQDIAYLYGELD